MNMMGQPLTGDREQIAKLLLAKTHASPNQQWMAKIIATWLSGESVLPDYLGLDPHQFKQLNQFYFPHIDVPSKAVSEIQLDYSRIPEKDDLVQLLNKFSDKHNQETDWLITLIVTACLGLDHLWQDLGVWQRTDLTDLISYNFPQLAESNTKNMKWKKFIYKKLCDAEGIYLCRAPSCEVCTDYSNCYGPED